MRALTCAAARRRLHAFHDGELPISEQIAVAAHLDLCRACAESLADVRVVGDALRVASHLRDELVHQRRLERYLGDDLLDRLAAGRDRLGPRSSLRAPRGGLQAGDLPLKPAQPSERQEHGLEFPRVELAAFRQHDDVVGRDLTTTQPVADVEEGLDGHRHTGESPAECHLSHFDSAADLDLLRRGQERDLADLLEVQADRVFATRGGGGLEDERPGGLLDLLLESDGSLRLVGAGVKRPWGRPRRLKSRCLTAFPECHDVTKLDSFYVYDA